MSWTSAAEGESDKVNISAATIQACLGATVPIKRDITSLLPPHRFQPHGIRHGPKDGGPTPARSAELPPHRANPYIAVGLVGGGMLPMLRAAAALLLLMLMSASAQAEKRIALLIGNQNSTSEIGRLANPHNDIALLE